MGLMLKLSDISTKFVDEWEQDDPNWHDEELEYLNLYPDERSVVEELENVLPYIGAVEGYEVIEDTLRLFFDLNVLESSYATRKDESERYLKERYEEWRLDRGI